MAAEAHITFVGNEGVLVEAAGGGTDGVRSVLVDALFGDGVPAYTTTPRAVVDSMEMARPPFDTVGVALATHFHPDHFNPYATSRFLQHSPQSEFASTTQSCQMLGTTPAFDTVVDRVHPVAPREAERTSLTIGGLRIDAFGLSHGKVNYGDVEHVGFVVYLGDVTVLHLGDGVIAERSLRRAGVLDERIDVAFLPFWYLTYPFGQRLLRGGFSPRRVFAVHIPPRHERRLVEEITIFDPDAVALVEPMSRHIVTTN